MDAMIRSTSLPPALGEHAMARPMRGFLLALGVVLASGVALAAWSATEVSPAPGAGLVLPRGPLLDRLLDQVKASPTQRDQAHQIFDAADADLRKDRGAERADQARMAQLFSQATVDAAAVEAVRARIEHRRDLESRRATQALIDVSLVLNPGQREAIAGELVGGPGGLAAFHLPNAAPAARND